MDCMEALKRSYRVSSDGNDFLSFVERSGGKAGLLVSTDHGGRFSLFVAGRSMAEARLLARHEGFCFILPSSSAGLADDVPCKVMEDDA